MLDYITYILIDKYVSEPFFLFGKIILKIVTLGRLPKYDLNQKQKALVAL